MDDASLEADPTPLSQKADEFGLALERVFGAGARAVGVDLLLPEAWSHSSLFSELVLRHGDRLTLAALSSPAGSIVGPEAVVGLTTAALGPKRASELFGLVNVRADRDRVVRKVPRFYRGVDGTERPIWAARVAETAGSAMPIQAGEDLRVDYSADVTQLRRVSWRDLASMLDEDRDLFANRIVLVGGEFTGSGDEMHPVPARNGAPTSVSGLVLQALILDSLLGERPFRDAPRLPLLVAFAAVGGGIAFGIIGSQRPIAAGAAGLSLLGAYTAAAFLLFREGLVLPVVEPLVVVLLILGAAVALRLRLSPHPGPEVPTA
jgi:CHASE2 domain-containing sensor protein